MPRNLSLWEEGGWHVSVWLCWRRAWLACLRQELEQPQRVPPRGLGFPGPALWDRLKAGSIQAAHLMLVGKGKGS